MKYKRKFSCINQDRLVFKFSSNLHLEFGR